VDQHLFQKEIETQSCSATHFDKTTASKSCTIGDRIINIAALLFSLRHNVLHWKKKKRKPKETEEIIAIAK